MNPQPLLRGPVCALMAFVILGFVAAFILSRKGCKMRDFVGVGLVVCLTESANKILTIISLVYGIPNIHFQNFRPLAGEFELLFAVIFAIRAVNLARFFCLEHKPEVTTADLVFAEKSRQASEYASCAIETASREIKQDLERALASAR